MNNTITKNTWYEDYLNKFDEAFAEEEREYLNGWANYFDEYINSYEIIDKEADDLIDLLYEFKENYRHSIVMPKSINYHELAEEAKEIEEAQDALEDLIGDTDNLYVGFDMERFLCNYEGEEFAKCVKEERPEFGDKLLNDNELIGLALQYIEHVMIGNPGHYSLCDLKEKLEDCGLNGEKLLNL